MSVSRGFNSYDMVVLGLNGSKQVGDTSKADSSRPFDLVLDCIKQNGFHSLGHFLVELFTVASSREKHKSHTLTQTVASFLNGKSSKYTVIHLVNILYHSRFSKPTPVRMSTTPRGEKDRPDERFTAKQLLQQWALEVVEDMVDSEAKSLVSPTSELRLGHNLTWDFAKDFSFQRVLRVTQESGPSILRVLEAVSLPSSKRKPRSYLSDGKVLRNEHFSGTTTPTAQTPERATTSTPVVQPPPSSASGRGHSKRDPFIVIAVTVMMLLNARNLQFNAFQKFIGVWLFANSATRELFDILCRMGLSTAYSAILEMLKDLSQSARSTIRTQAIAHRFKLIYDNVNRQRRVWDAELGERDTVESGTAAMFVALDDCSPSASDVAVLEQAWAEKRRRQLDIDVLVRRIDHTHLCNIFAVHIVSFLVQEVPYLAPLLKRLNHRLRVDLAKHRMRNGRRTKAYPLATSEYNEGSTQGNREVIDDLVLNQLRLPEQEVAQMMTILGGDQSTVEKIRTLKKFMSSCPHGYHRYGWVLPVVQLWHMGWADLERILSTHWGHKSGSEDDISTLGFINQLLGRKVKNVARPDYYPAQNLVFDTLRVEVLDCWCEYLSTDLSGLEDKTKARFAISDEETTLQGLLTAAEKIAHTYMFTPSADLARTAPMPSSKSLLPSYIQFPTGRSWSTSTSPQSKSASPEAALGGDVVLANTILRMRDSMLHYEFHSAIADGDIGRAMNIMNVWTFTFCGSGKNKYTNELLEIACNFEFEYSESLKQDQLNNWLCNMTGQLGRWFPMDLLMEHNINLLKRMSGHHATSFTSPFFKETISLNIRHFLDVKESLRVAVKLGARQGAHTKKKKRVALEHLARTMREHELHRLRAGRTYGFIAQDDFQIGWDRFAHTSRLSDFIERTLGDGMDLDEALTTLEPSQLSSSIEANHGNSENGPQEVPDLYSEAPLPHIWEDGHLMQGVDTDSDSDTEDRTDA